MAMIIKIALSGTLPFTTLFIENVGVSLKTGWTVSSNIHVCNMHENLKENLDLERSHNLTVKGPYMGSGHP